MAVSKSHSADRYDSYSDSDKCCQRQHSKKVRMHTVNCNVTDKHPDAATKAVSQQPTSLACVHLS